VTMTVAPAMFVCACSFHVSLSHLFHVCLLSFFLRALMSVLLPLLIQLHSILLLSKLSFKLFVLRFVALFLLVAALGFSQTHVNFF
jgi:hypothetical protein